MRRFDGKTVIVTGAGTGIGFSVAKRFWLEGANVVMSGRREDVLREAAGQIAVDPERLLVAPADIANESDVVNLVAEAIRWTSRVDVLINNAAGDADQQTAGIRPRWPNGGRCWTPTSPAPGSAAGRRGR